MNSGFEEKILISSPDVTIFYRQTWYIVATYDASHRTNGCGFCNVDR